MNIGQNGYIK